MEQNEIKALKSLSTEKLRLLNFNVITLGKVRIIGIIKEDDNDSEENNYKWLLDNLPEETENKETLESTIYSLYIKRPYGLVELLVSEIADNYNIRVDWEEQYTGVILTEDGSVIVENIDNRYKMGGTKKVRNNYRRFIERSSKHIMSHIKNYGIDTKYISESVDNRAESIIWTFKWWPGFICDEIGRYQIAHNGLTNYYSNEWGINKCNVVIFDKLEGEVIADEYEASLYEIWNNDSIQYTYKVIVTKSHLIIISNKINRVYIRRSNRLVKTELKLIGAINKSIMRKVLKELVDTIIEKDGTCNITD